MRSLSKTEWVPAELLVIAVALVLPTLATYAYFILLGGKPGMQAAYAASKIVQFSLPVIWMFLVRREWQRPKREAHSGIITGVLFGAVTAIAILALYFTLLKGSPALAAMGGALREKVAGMGASTPFGFIVLGVFISVIHSFLEEYYWRWFVFARLHRLSGFTTALVVSSLGFMAHHVLVVGVYLNWQHWPLLLFLSLSVAVGGAVWAWLYQKTGSLVSPWLSHLLVDCSLMVVGYDQLWGL
jgi:membrane protease YdiL (CAAX protease family)